MHNRSYQVHSFEREDGLWDIEAELIDSKAYDFARSSGAVRHAGEAFHHMHMRVTIDSAYLIHDAVVVYDAAPFGERCTSISDQYRDLIGMNLVKNFRQQVKERFARTDGCTHMTELAAVLPTAAVQTMTGQRRSSNSASTRRPFQLDGCHAWRLDGEVTKEHYPQWYVLPSSTKSTITD
jgi:fructose-1,6-bisphosphatase